MRQRNLNSYSTLGDIIDALNSNDFPDNTWVGKDYSKGQLICDLQKIEDSGTFVTKNGVQPMIRLWEDVQ